MRQLLTKPGWARSLRGRLLAGTVLAALLTLLAAGLGLARLLADQVQQQQRAMLSAQLDELVARLSLGPDGRPQLAGLALADPRWHRPFGGLYWQVDGQDAAAGAAPQRGLLRSRSLWDAVLQVPDDRLADGALHLHPVAGPDGNALLLAERSITLAESAAGGPRWRVMVAVDQRETQAALARFHRVLAGALLLLGALLCAGALAQVAVGLRPLRTLQQALAALRQGRSAQLAGQFPAELQPLVDDFNTVLARHATLVDRARSQAGDLAHAVKTPLAVLAQAAEGAQQQPAEAAALPALVLEQVAQARRQVDWQLSRARVAAAPGLPGARVALAPVLAGLLRVMDRVHAQRGLKIEAAPVDAALHFAGDPQDLQEMLGNLLDNACKWAAQRVQVQAVARPQPVGTAASGLCITVDDDGPGIAEAQRAQVLARGARLDESVPGSGLGLAIVLDRVQLHGGSLDLAQSPSGGLRVRLMLPAAG